jgi:uncharacterized protein (DUF2252 family)
MADEMAVAQKIERGRALRGEMPRASHAAVGAVDRDPIALLEASSEGRVERLVPLRYGRMLASPFAFYRGSAIIQAHDLATTPRTGLAVQICGDAHLSNFGGFATPERNFVFDINDFDETHPGPWEWDVKRLAASVVLAARHLGFEAEADAMVHGAVESYRTSIREFSEMTALDLWYQKTTFESLLERSTYDEGRRQIEKAIEKAAQRTHENLLPRMADKVNGRWVMRDTPPSLFHVQGRSTLLSAGDDWISIDVPAAARVLFENYLESLTPSQRHLLGKFEYQDVAFKVVGVGSVGTRCLAMLLSDLHDDPLFLQIKEANRSVLAGYLAPEFKTVSHEGQRIVTGQRLMQSAGDSFLGWGTGQLGRQYYVRQLRDMKFSAELELFDETLLGNYARLCAETLARAHARSGYVALEIGGYLGGKERFAEALVDYAKGYADQVEKDYAEFRRACRQGRLEARTDEDMAADFAAA